MAEAVDIIRNQDGTRGVYHADIPGTDVRAELTWKARENDSGPVRIVDHTFVPPEARGMGIAGQLVAAIIADAQEQGFTIVPQCPYVAKAFDKHPEWADLRAQ